MGLIISSISLVAKAIFICSPLGGIYYFIQAHLLDIIRRRSKILQAGLDKIHYVQTEDLWRLAIIRYSSNPKARKAQYPVLLVHGLSANRMVFDLVENEHGSLARYLSGRGFDVWVLEMRGSNLSFHPDYNAIPQIRQWTFDDYVERDLPTAINFVLSETNSTQLHIIGHSMGGMLSLCYTALGSQQANSIRSSTLVASALSYAECGSFFEKAKPLHKLLKTLRSSLFLPHGLIQRLQSSFMGRGLDFLPFYSFQCWPSNVDPALVRKVYQFGYHTIPGSLAASLLPAVSTINGIANESGVAYLDMLRHLSKEGVNLPPALILGADKDEQCPVKAVERCYEQMAEINPSVQLKIFGKSNGQVDHYGHTDILVGSRVAVEVFPVIYKFLRQQDNKEEVGSAPNTPLLGPKDL